MTRLYRISQVRLLACRIDRKTNSIRFGCTIAADIWSRTRRCCEPAKRGRDGFHHTPSPLSKWPRPTRTTTAGSNATSPPNLHSSEFSLRRRYDGITCKSLVIGDRTLSLAGPSSASSRGLIHGPNSPKHTHCKLGFDMQSVGCDVQYCSLGTTGYTCSCYFHAHGIQLLGQTTL